MKATVTHIEHDAKYNIVFLEDLSNLTGAVTVTNDAENVVTWFRSIYGNRVRIVYKDTENEWWEIKWSIGLDGTTVWFKQWYGIEWDILSRVEN